MNGSGAAVGVLWIGCAAALCTPACSEQATTGAAPAGRSVSVLEHHARATRDGVFIDPAFTRAKAAKIHRDPGFDAKLDGPAHGQALYFEGGPGGKDVVIVATQKNQISAFDSLTGAVVWQRTLGAPVPRSTLPCGNVDPVGVTGTPVIDAASRTLFLDAMTSVAGAPKHMIYALSVDDGSTKAGWPVDVGASVKAGAVSFDPAVQNQRGALAILDGTVYIPYGGRFGDCGNYRGWVIGVPMSNPSAPFNWATRALGGGSWGPSGIASDGKSLFVSTGNTRGASVWSDGEAVIRLPPTLQFSKATEDYFAPTNWQALDGADLDLGGSGPVLFDAPGATPAELALALGKDGYAYLLDRNNLGGVGGAIATLHVSAEPLINAAVAYTTSLGTYFAVNRPGLACPGATARITAIKVSASSPPKLSFAWCMGGNGYGSPIVTTTNGRDDAVVWWVAAERDGLLRGYDADTGAIVYNGGPPAEGVGVRRLQAPIVAKGRMYLAGDLALVAYAVD